MRRLSNRGSPQMDGWRRHSQWHITGSNRWKRIRAIYTTLLARSQSGLRRNSRSLRKGLELRICEYVVLADSNVADTHGKQSPPGIRTFVRRCRKHRCEGAPRHTPAKQQHFGFVE